MDRLPSHGADRSARASVLPLYPVAIRRAGGRAGAGVGRRLFAVWAVVALRRAIVVPYGAGSNHRDAGRSLGGASALSKGLHPARHRRPSTRAWVPDHALIPCLSAYASRSGWSGLSTYLVEKVQRMEDTYFPRGSERRRQNPLCR